jgi:hypothetical protein
MPDLNPGDLVLVKGSRMGANAARLTELAGANAPARKKTLPRWVGPFAVMRRVNANVYTLVFPSGINVSNKVNVKDLKLADGLDDCPPPPVRVGLDGTL